MRLNDTTHFWVFFVVIIVAMLVGPVSQWFPEAWATTVRTGPQESARFTRACEMKAGSGWTAIDCSAGAAYSAALTKNTRYIVQAIGGSPYIAMTTAGSGQDADSNDGYLPQGSWLELFVPDAARYISCDGSADSSTLVYVECQ